MDRPTFVYVIYVRANAEKLWRALTEPDFTRRYWSETWQDSTWKKGAPWKIMAPDGRVADSGEVLEIDRPNKLVVTWRNEFMPELKKEGYSVLTWEIEDQSDDSVKLTITHQGGPKFVEAVSTGWPTILSSLKSMLETGEPLANTTRWPEGV
jgi:uncharacterized protein YndB with AHSA1/START domain